MSQIQNLSLRRTIESDLEQLFEYQADADYNNMAAFTGKDPSNKAAYMIKWKRIMADEASAMHSILVENVLVGCVFISRWKDN